MKYAKWRLLALGAAVALMLVYFIELTTNGLKTMTGQDEIISTYNNAAEQEYIKKLIEQEAGLQQNVQQAMPLASSLDAEIIQLEAEVQALKKQALLQEKKQLEQLLLNENVDQSNVNKLADSTSGVLQSVSSSGMQFVAELFHKVID